jgi:hypothetical protein
MVGVEWSAYFSNPLPLIAAMRMALHMYRQPTSGSRETFHCNIVCTRKFQGIKFVKEVRNGVVIYGMVPADVVNIIMPSLPEERAARLREQKKHITSVSIAVSLAEVTREMLALKPSSRLVLWGTVDMLMFSVADGNNRTVETGIPLTSDGGGGGSASLRPLDFLDNFHIPSAQFKGDIIRASAKFTSDAAAGAVAANISIYDVGSYAPGREILTSSLSGTSGVMFNPILLSRPVALDAGPADDDSAFHAREADIRDDIPMREEHLRTCPRIFSGSFKLDVLADILKNVPEPCTLILRVNGQGNDKNKCVLEVNLGDTSAGKEGLKYLCRVMYIMSI